MIVKLGPAELLGAAEGGLVDFEPANYLGPPWCTSSNLAYIESHLHPQTFDRSAIMGKAKETSKEAKKQPTKTAKEKRAAKQAKKHGLTHTPLIVAH